jgi:hypothetical protein
MPLRLSVAAALVAAALLVAGGVLFHRLGRRPVYHSGQRAEAFPRFLAALDAESPDGAVLVIEHEGTERFVQFAKYVEEPEDPVILLGFPDAPWSRAFYEPVRERLTAAGFDVSESFGTGDAVPRFLDVGGLPDPARAAEAAVLAFDVMGIGTGATFTLSWPGGAAPGLHVEFKPRAV